MWWLGRGRERWRRKEGSEGKRERDEQDTVSVSISQRTVIEGAAGHH